MKQIGIFLSVKFLFTEDFSNLAEAVILNCIKKKFQLDRTYCLSSGSVTATERQWQLNKKDLSGNTSQGDVKDESRHQQSPSHSNIPP